MMTTLTAAGQRRLVELLREELTHLASLAEKREARAQVTAAIIRGDLTPQPCESCGRDRLRGRRAQAHHDDHTRPLDVRWLCTFCHPRIDAAQLAADTRRRRAEVIRLAGTNPFAGRDADRLIRIEAMHRQITSHKPQEAAA